VNIVVCIKQVPDTDEVRIDPETNNLVRQGIPSIINPYDETGVEWALELKEKHGGTVTLLSMGLPQASKELVHGLGMGADRAILLSDKRLGGSDTLATGYALSETIKKLNIDLVICGLEAIDGSTAQVGPSIAENLGIPQFTYVSGIKGVKDGKITITKKIQQFTEEYEAHLPVVISVLKNSAVPRESKPLPDLEKKIEVWNADHLDESRIGFNGSPTRVVHIETSGSGGKDYVDVDRSLSAEERIDFIISGGMNVKKDIRFIRGSALDMAKLIISNMNHNESGGAVC
jgi:electron transfer flavoprotein beta subunit